MHTKYIAMKYVLAYKEGRSWYCINTVRSRVFFCFFFLQPVSLFVLIFRNCLKNIFKFYFEEGAFFFSEKCSLSIVSCLTLYVYSGFGLAEQLVSGLSFLKQTDSIYVGRTLGWHTCCGARGEAGVQSSRHSTRRARPFHAVAYFKKCPLARHILSPSLQSVIFKNNVDFSPCWIWFFSKYILIGWRLLVPQFKDFALSSTRILPLIGVNTVQSIFFF